MFTTHPGPRATLLTCLFALPLVAPGPCGGLVDTYDLGVGAFEVDHDGALLWTHVVPVDPATNVVPLKVQIALDLAFEDMVRQQGGRLFAPTTSPSASTWAA